MRTSRRVRLVALAVLLMALLAAPTYALGRAAIGWLSGEPAPESAVANFRSYTPQLGFEPQAGKAVVVARDGGFALYATGNDRRTYCVATSTPDGGICVKPRVAQAPVVAGIMPSDPTRRDARHVTLVAGRVADPSAAAITFTDPYGSTVRRTLGDRTVPVSQRRLDADVPGMDGDGRGNREHRYHSRRGPGEPRGSVPLVERPASLSGCGVRPARR